MHAYGLMGVFNTGLNPRLRLSGSAVSTIENDESPGFGTFNETYKFETWENALRVIFKVQQLVKHPQSILIQSGVHFL